MSNLHTEKYFCHSEQSEESRALRAEILSAQQGTQNDNMKMFLKLSYTSPFARLSLFTLGAMLILLVSGFIVRLSGATSACSWWPLCSQGQLLPTTPLEWMAMWHRLIVALVGVLNDRYVDTRLAIAAQPHAHSCEHHRSNFAVLPAVHDGWHQCDP